MDVVPPPLPGPPGGRPVRRVAHRHEVTEPGGRRVGWTIGGAVVGAVAAAVLIAVRAPLATIATIAVPIVLGVVIDRQRTLSDRARARRRELHALVEHLRAASATAGRAALIEETGAHLADLLRLRTWAWEDAAAPGTPTVDGLPRLHDDGSVSGLLVDIGDDPALLPTTLALPVSAGRVALGRFVVETSPAVVSAEERAVAGAILGDLAHRLAERSRDQPAT